MLDFAAIKLIRITDVCARYGVALTFGGKYAKAKCPLPTHNQGDADKNFNINLEGNYWKCWSESCNEKAGARGGDVINFVALMENCSQHEAAKKLADWFHVGDTATTFKTGEAAKSSTNEKAAQPIAARPNKQPSKGTKSHGTSSSMENKGYMAEIDRWFGEIIQQGDQESSEDYQKRLRNGIKDRLIESYRSGKRAAQGLEPVS